VQYAILVLLLVLFELAVIMWAAIEKPQVCSDDFQQCQAFILL
jgi:hypothetical protein